MSLHSCSLVTPVQEPQHPEEPIQPELVTYVFEDGVNVPPPSSECYAGLLEEIMAKWNQGRDARLKEYRLSEQEIIDASDKVRAEIEKEFIEVKKEPRLRMLRSVYAKMVSHLPPRLQNLTIHLVKHRRMGTSYDNAFIIPGHIYFTVGLFRKATDKDKVATVIGHELGHAIEENFEEQLRTHKRWIDRLSGFGADPDGLPVGLATNLENFLATPLGQDDELQCDMIGAVLTFAAGYDPNKGAEFWDNVMKREKKGRSILETMSVSHPMAENRKKCLDGYLAMAKESARLVNELNLREFEQQMIIYEMKKAQYRKDLASYKRRLKQQQTLKELSNNKALPIAFLLLGFVCFVLWILSKKRRYLLIAIMLVVIGFVWLLPTLKLQKREIHTPMLQAAETTEVSSEAVVLTPGLYLRSGPSTSFDPVHILAGKEVIWCIECGPRDTINNRPGKWCKVEDKEGRKGWVWGRNIKLKQFATPVGYQPDDEQ